MDTLPIDSGLRLVLRAALNCKALRLSFEGPSAYLPPIIETGHRLQGRFQFNNGLMPLNPRIRDVRPIEGAAEARARAAFDTASSARPPKTSEVE